MPMNENDLEKLYLVTGGYSFEYEPYNTPINIKVDGEDMDIGTGSTRIMIEEDEDLHLIKNGILVMDVSENREVSTSGTSVELGAYKLITNFDTSRLVEE